MPAPTITSDRSLINLWIQRYAPNTARSYIRDISLFYDRIGRKLDDITTEQITRYIEDIEVPSEAVRRRILHAIKSLYRFGMKINYLNADSAAAVHHVVREPTADVPKALSERDVTAILRAADGREYVILALAYYAALSSLELAALTWDDLLPKQKKLRVTAEPFPRIVPIADHLWARLIEYRDSMDFLTEPMFPSRFGGGCNFLSARQIARIIHVAGERVGVDASTSKLRNSHAQHALARGASLKDVQLIMRHNTSRTTVRHQRENRQPRMIRSVDVLPKV